VDMVSLHHSSVNNQDQGLWVLVKVSLLLDLDKATLSNLPGKDSRHPGGKASLHPLVDKVFPLLQVEYQRRGSPGSSQGDPDSLWRLRNQQLHEDSTRTRCPVQFR